MSSDIDFQRKTETVGLGRREVGFAGGLVVVGLLLNAVSTLFHPAGEEDNHEVIFTAYANSDSWIAVHLGQFVGVLLALGGLLVLTRVMRAAGRSTLLPQFAAAAAVATAATWAVLQGLDGVGLKYAVDAWYGASGADKAIRLANAETVRWLEWGFQSYFRVLLGLTLLLVGAAMLAGLFSTVIGIDVGYNGLASEIQDTLSIAFLLVVLVFAVGVLVTGMRGRSDSPPRT